MPSNMFSHPHLQPSRKGQNVFIRSPSPFNLSTSPTMQRRRYLTRAGAIALLTVLTIIALYRTTISHLQSASRPYTTFTKAQYDTPFPRRIWQTWEDPIQDMNDEYSRFTHSWQTMNREYRYELLNSDSATTFVEDHFRLSHPHIVTTFHRLADNILRADLFRYLALLAAGGVYTDLDTECSRAVRDWVPAEFDVARSGSDGRAVTRGSSHAKRANVVFGIEYDARDDPQRDDLAVPAQICQWTMLAKPGHPVVAHVVERVVEALVELGRNHSTVAGGDGWEIRANSTSEVMDATGPRVFTSAVLEALTIRTGRKVTYKDLGNIDEPKLIGDVLILPISAFASGQEHSASKDWGNDEQLVSHHWRGFQGWKTLYNE